MTEQSALLLGKILNLIQEQIACMDLNRRLIWLNQDAIRLYGALSLDELVGRYCYEVQFGRTEPCEDCPFNYVLATGNSHCTEIKTSAGEVYLSKGFPLVDENGVIFALVEICSNITEKVQTGKELSLRNEELSQMNTTLREKEECLTLALGVSKAGYWEWNLETNRIYFDDLWHQMLGYERREDLSNAELIHPEDQLRVWQALYAHIQGETESYQSEYRIKASDGCWRWFSARGKISSYGSDGKPTRMIGITQDVTEQKNFENFLKEIAYIDNLTGLPNRSYIIEELGRRLKRPQEGLVVLFVDLDRFKRINDSLGHDLGDKILQMAGKRLVETAGEGALVGRIGGDEFIVILENLPDRAQVETLARNVLASFARPFAVEHNLVHVSISIGISMYPDDGRDADSLIRNADIAMYFVKTSGRNNLFFYSRKQSELIAREIFLENHLRRALDQGEFLLHYMPKVDLYTGRITGLEALLRWKHPELGFIPPLDFIGIAEETGLIQPIDKWVMKTACEQNKVWQAAGFEPVRMAVNVSGKQFEIGDLSETVAGVLQETGLDPKYLELELTETVLIDIERAKAVLNKVKELGVSIAIDDFGTGYSSLNVLASLPIDTLKIDRSFIQKIGGEQPMVLVETIIKIGLNLNLEVVAEGVDHIDQISFLKEHGCQIGQGFYYGKPVPAEEIELMLRAGGVLTDAYLGVAK